MRTILGRGLALDLQLSACAIEGQPNGPVQVKSGHPCGSSDSCGECANFAGTNLHNFITSP